MQDQDAHRRHEWKLEERVGHPEYDAQYIQIEVCSKCKAKRSVLYPHGIILKSEPEKVAKFCEAGQGEGYVVK